MNYLPALDGIRCLAVLMVMLYHFHNFAAGWIGVQVFFVLSGYLITSLLLDARERQPDVYFRRFYWRRTLRIFPVYFGYMAVVTLVYLAVRRPPEFGGLWPYLWTYTSNFARMGVHDRGGEFFVHFWSLAVEEQYYLVWPLVVYLLSRQSLKRVVVALLVGAPLLRWGLGLWLSAGGMDGERIARIAGVFTLAQFDAFAAGSAIVLFRLDRVRFANRWAVGGLALWLLAGAAMLLTLPAGVARDWSIDTLGHHSTTVNAYHVWGNSLTNLVSAAVLAATVSGSFAWLLEQPVAVYIGRISYGVYVYHLPMHYLLNQAYSYRHSSPWGTFVVFPLYCAAVIAVATLSYYGFEQRFLRLKDRIRSRMAPALSALSPAGELRPSTPAR